MVILPSFGDEKQNIVIEESTLQNACRSVLSTIAANLPEDVQTIEVFEYVLQESQNLLRQMIVRL